MHSEMLLHSVKADLHEKQEQIHQLKRVLHEIRQIKHDFSETRMCSSPCLPVKMRPVNEMLGLREIVFDLPNFVQHSF